MDYNGRGVTLVLDWNRRGGAVVLKWKRRGAALDLDWNRRGAAVVQEEKSGRVALVLEVFFCCFAYFGSKFDHVLYLISKM